jgi:hypothetical protein
VVSSEQDANSVPDESHLIALTSSYRNAVSCKECTMLTISHYRMADKRLYGSGLTDLTNVDHPVGRARCKDLVVVPVDIQSGC